MLKELVTKQTIEGLKTLLMCQPDYTIRIIEEDKLGNDDDDDDDDAEKHPVLDGETGRQISGQKLDEELGPPANFKNQEEHTTNDEVDKPANHCKMNPECTPGENNPDTETACTSNKNDPLCDIESIGSEFQILEAIDEGCEASGISSELALSSEEPDSSTLSCSSDDGAPTDALEGATCATDINDLSDKEVSTMDSVKPEVVETTTERGDKDVSTMDSVEPEVVEWTAATADATPEVLTAAAISAPIKAGNRRPRKRVYASLNVHEKTLQENAGFYQKLKQERNRNNGVIKLVVRTGHGKCAQNMIFAFYNPAMITGLPVHMLVGISLVADKFANDIFLKRCASMMNDSKVEELPECQLIMEQLIWLDTTSGVIQEALLRVHRKCMSFMGKYFVPLEYKPKAVPDFLELSFYSLEPFVRSQTLADSENSVASFVLDWLRHEPLRQTSDNIERLMLGVRAQSLEADFLVDMVGIDNPILNLWSGYRDWFVDALLYHASSPFLRGLKKFLPCGQVRDRSHQSLVSKSWFIPMKKICNNNNKQEYRSEELVTVYKGYQISLTSFSMHKKKSSQNFSVSMGFRCNGIFDEFELEVGILPADRKYPKDKIKWNKTFRKTYTKWASLSFKSKDDEVTIEYGTANQGFVELAERYGIYAVLIPFPKHPYHCNCRKESSGDDFCTECEKRTVLLNPRMDLSGK